MTSTTVKLAGSDPKTSSPAIAEAMRWGRRTRFNPLATLTPASLTRSLEGFERGDLREAAMLWHAMARRDDTIPGVKAKREKSIAHKALETVKLDKSEAAEEHREVLSAFWANARFVSAWDRSEEGGVRKLITRMQEAVSFQYSVHHIVWRPTKDGLRATFEFVPLWFFEAREARLRFLPSGYGLEGAELDPSEWLISSGDGLMTAASIGYFCKRATLQDWLRFSERFSQPGVLGRTSAAKGTPQGDAMRQAVNTFGNDWSAVLYGDDGSKTSGIELIQADGNPAAMPMPALIERVDRKISALYRGADLSTMSAGGGEGSGASLQGEEQDILERADASERSEELRRIERIVIAWHFGEGVEPLAQTRIIVPEREDQRLLLDAVKTFVGMGARLRVGETLARFGLSEADEDEAALGEGKEPRDMGHEEEPGMGANAFPDDVAGIDRKIAEALLAAAVDGFEGRESEDNAYDPNQPRTPSGSPEGGRWSGKKSDNATDFKHNENHENSPDADSRAKGAGRPSPGVARAAAERVLGRGEGAGGEELAARLARETEALDELRLARPDLVVEPDDETYLDGGAESDVHLDGGRVLKFGRHYGFTLDTGEDGGLVQRRATPSELLARIDAHNDLFGDGLEMVALGPDGLVLSQPHFPGNHPEPERLWDYLGQAGYRPIPPERVDERHAHLRETTWISDAGVILGDVRTDNFMETGDGEIHPLDLYIVRDRSAASNTATTDALWKDAETSGGDRYPAILAAPNAAAVSPDADGWYQIAPYGEWPTTDGQFVQVFGREQAEKMVRHYNSLPFRVTRWLMNREVPVFIGHPDVDRRTWSDERKLATRHRRLEVREDGLYGQAEWNALGRDNLENGYWQYPSPVWLFPKPKRGTKRVFPDLLQSVGLTNFQNIPDARRVTFNTADPGDNPNQQHNPMKELIAELGLEEGASEEDILSAVRNLKQAASDAKEAKTKADGDVAAANAARETAETALSGLRTTAANAMIDTAVEGGAITLAEKKGWQERFATDYAGAANALAAVKPGRGLNTKAVELPGKPTAAPATAKERIAAVNAAVAQEMQRNGGNYDLAHAAVKADPKMKPIFEAMNPSEEGEE